MIVVFKRLRWRNLLSTGNIFTEIQLDKSPTTLIIGPNGSGKSTFLDALCYALFKKPFRKINKDQLINTINGGDCVLEVEFSIGTREYKVCRGIKPDFFEVYVDGDKRKQEAAKKDDQAFLEEDILKVGYDAFLQVVILGHARYTPFMQLTTPKRREFIEHILDIRVFSIMSEGLKIRQAIMKTDLEHNGTKVHLLNEQLSLVEGFVAKLRQEQNQVKHDIQDKVDQGNQVIQALKTEIAHVEVEIEAREKTITDHDMVLERLQLLNDKNRSTQSERTAAQKKIAFYVGNEVCNTCSQAIEESHRNSIVTDMQTVVTKCDAALETIAKHREKLQQRVSVIGTVVKDVQTLNATIQEKNGTIRATRGHVARLESDLKREPGNIKEHEEKLEALSLKLNGLSVTKDELIQQRHFYELAAVLLKDSGIKAAIVKQYLPAINRLVNRYLAELDFFLSFSIDEGFNETFKSRHRDTLSYYSFSEGEKLRIDLALLFTWRDVARMKNSCATNLLVLDEVIDSSLDQNGTDYVIKLFNDLGKTSNVFVISHKNDAALDKFHDVLRFEKTANFSRLAAA